LIKRNLVVTAAHCVNGKSFSNIVVYLGAQDRSALSASGVVKVGVSKSTVVNFQMKYFLIFINFSAYHFLSILHMIQMN
jgi:hypothetical protein